MSGKDLALLRHIAIRAGDTLAHDQIGTWLQMGTCVLNSSAASGVLGDITGRPKWPRNETPLRPLSIPGNFGKGGVAPGMAAYSRLTGQLRANASPQQPAD